MKYFFPDSQDLVDPSFDFDRESRADLRVRHRDDVYAHEVFSTKAYDGVLVSKGIVDGQGGGGAGRYTIAQRHRLLRVGVREFFRLNTPARKTIETMGDCGAFSYAREQVPPFSASEVLEFYSDCGFDYGMSVDHVILGYDAKLDKTLPGVDGVPPAWRERQEITLSLAADFWAEHRRLRLRLKPVGVAQGWSPASYARAVRSLQRIGYDYIALGGLVPLKSHEIADTVVAVDAVRSARTRFHLLGVTRLEHFDLFDRHGVVSFDSTSPLRQAFKDDKDNYYTMERAFTAVRVPQVEANPRLKKAILSGQIDQGRAMQLERDCLAKLTMYGQRATSLRSVLDSLEKYEALYDGESIHRAVYEEVLEARPWDKCRCEVCRALGIHVIIFRGAERNRRRGFHNTFVFYERLRREFGESKSKKKAGSVRGRRRLEVNCADA